MQTSRRNFVLAATAFGFATAVRPRFALAGDAAHVGPGPDIVVPRLMAGNARFMEGHRTARYTPLRREELASGQYPIAAILACADSRVAPEIIFDEGLGDLFVVRVAGNVVDDYGLASLEYAVAALGVRTVMVLGHSECGAVKAALDQASAAQLPGELPGLTKHIYDGVKQQMALPANASGKDKLDAAIAVNVQKQVDVLNASTTLPKYVKPVGGIYNLASGKVTLLEKGKTAAT